MSIDARQHIVTTGTSIPRRNHDPSQPLSFRVVASPRRCRRFDSLLHGLRCRADDNDQSRVHFSKRYAGILPALYRYVPSNAERKPEAQLPGVKRRPTTAGGFSATDSAAWSARVRRLAAREEADPELKPIFATAWRGLAISAQLHCIC